MRARNSWISIQRKTIFHWAKLRTGISWLTGILLFFSPMLVHAIPYDATVSVDPAAATVSVGDSLSVNIDVEILSMDLYAAAIGLSYDTSILNFTGATEGGLLSSLGSTLFDVSVPDPPTAGENLLVIDMLLGSVSGAPAGTSGILATLYFNVIGAGISPISFAYADLAAFDYTLLNVETRDGSVNAVPEPATLMLLGAGLAVLLTTELLRKKSMRRFS